MGERCKTHGGATKCECGNPGNNWGDPHCQNAALTADADCVFEEVQSAVAAPEKGREVKRRMEISARGTAQVRFNVSVEVDVDDQVQEAVADELGMNLDLDDLNIEDLEVN